MKKIRDTAPIIMIVYSLIFTIACIWCPDDLYESVIYPYLSHSIGFSFFTNLVLISFYFNKKYCLALKFSVIGLFIMNIVSIICIYFTVSPYWFDFYICLICLAVYVQYRIQK